jgi:hypothetical protein
VSYEFLLYTNSYIKSNLATKEAAVSISDDLEGNMKAILGEEISDVLEASVETKEEAAVSISDGLEGNMKQYWKWRYLM